MASAAEFLIELNSIKDIDAWILAKVPIKNEIVQSDLNWDSCRPLQKGTTNKRKNPFPH
jgi:hypothetical protein